MRKATGRTALLGSGPPCQVAPSHMAFSSPFGSELFHTGKSDRPPGRGADLRVHKRISSRTPPSSFALFAKHLWFAIPPLSPPREQGGSLSSLRSTGGTRGGGDLQKCYPIFPEKSALKCGRSSTNCGGDACRPVNHLNLRMGKCQDSMP